jgi:predicted GH43/DUF377 family glycosyl hydrolase
MNNSKDLVIPFAGNPVLTASQWPYPVNAVLNPAAVQVVGQTLLLVRVEDRRGFSHLAVARSADGIDGWQIETRPAFAPDPDHPEESFGVEDPRVTPLLDDQLFGVVYCAYGPQGPMVAIATTPDFHAFERLGGALPPENKDAALFPIKIGGRYALLHRPVSPMSGGGNIWISYSPDLRHWGDHREVLRARHAPWWDAGKIGLNTPPLETERGWLIMYHGVRNTCAGAIYRCGFALLDRDDPSQVVGRSEEWALGPTEYEARVGDVDNVVFPCGLIAEGDSLRIYYGMADSAIGVAMASLKDVLATL